MRVYIKKLYKRIQISAIEPNHSIGTRRKDQIAETLATYIYTVLKQVHPEFGISKKAMNIMNSFINDSFDSNVLEASKLVRFNKRHTLSSREIKSAVKLLLPGDQPPT